MNCTLTNFIARARVVFLFAFAMCAAVSAEARSITGVQRLVTEGKMFLDVTFEAGSEGDNHALYIAYDMEDKGDDIGDWDALQRGCVVAAGATSATIPVSPLLTEKGYTFCRVFLTTTEAPYDTLIESLRQSRTQYIDTGIYPDGTTVAVMDVKLDSNDTAQQRFFGVSSDKDSVEFSFDVYINGNTNKKYPIRGISSACADGIGDWERACKFIPDRLLITLSATNGHHITIDNLDSGEQIVHTEHNSTKFKNTSAATLLVFAQHIVGYEDAIPADKIATGAYLYSFTMTKAGEPVCDYRPCMLGGRAGVYDSVKNGVVFSDSGTDFDAANSGSPIACSLLEGETQVAAAPKSMGLSDYVWRGTLTNWGDPEAWTVHGDNATWTDGKNAFFVIPGATAALAANVTAKKLVFEGDAMVSGSATLTVPTVQVDPGVTATISAPTAGALEKTGAGTLTLAQDRIDATIVTEGTLKMDGATVAGLTLGTYGGAPVTFDYGGQELVKNAHGLDYLVTGSTVMLTNGIFSTASDYDLNIRNDTFTMPSVLTIAKDAVVRQSAKGKKVYLNYINGAATINVIGGMLGNIEGCEEVYLQYKSADGRLDINVLDGGLVYFPCTIYALCAKNNFARTSPALCLTLFNSAFVGGTFNFGSSYNGNSYVPTNPTGVFAATNSVISIEDAFKIGQNVQVDGKTGGRYTADFEDCTVTAKTFAVYYDRPLNNARFNGSWFVFNVAGGSIAASDDESNWFTVGDDGLTIDTQDFTATLNANLGGSGVVTKVGAGTLTVSRDQATTGGFNIAEGTLTINGNKTFAGPVEFAAGSTLNITSYNCTMPLRASTLTLPAEGTVALTLNGGVFDKGVYAICAASGVTAADGAKFAPSTGDLDFSWSVSGDKLVLTVGDVSGNYWTGLGGDGRMSAAENWLNGVPAEGSDIDLSFISSPTTIIADAEWAFGTVTMGDVVITFTNALTVAGFSDPTKVAVDADSTVTIDGDVTLDAAGQKLCKTVAAGGTLRITGVVEISHSSGEVKTADLATNGAGAPGTVVVEGGIAVKTGASVIWNAKTLAIGANGISFAADAPFYFSVDDAEVYPLDVSTVLGTAGKGKFRSMYDDVFLCATQYGSDQPAEITFDGFFDSVKNYYGHWRATGCGRVVCTSAAKSDRGLRVYDGATLALNPNIASFGQSDQTFYVYNENSETAGGTLEVASSGIVTLVGDLSLADGTELAFNFTNHSTPPQLALSSGKTMTASGAVSVKISGDVWPVSGEYQLTTCGGFNADGVTVSRSSDSAKWAKKVEVKDGNIVLTVRPMPTVIIVR